MTRRFTVACLQTRPRETADSATAEAMPLAERAADAGAALICLPEYAGGLATDGAAVRPPAIAEGAHPLVAALTGLARARGVWILLGSVAVPGAGGRILNRGLMIAPDGRVNGHYDKIHMFDIDLAPGQSHRESATVSPGARAVLHDTPLARIGHTICYDLRFPMLYRDLAQAGAEILAVPAAFTRSTGEAHWHILNRARAIENGAFVVAPCAVGPVPGGGEVYGHSLVVDPWGTVLADGGTEPGVVLAEIDPEQVAQARLRIPSLRHGRPYDAPEQRRPAAE